jgi:hypothetical protein
MGFTTTTPEAFIEQKKRNRIVALDQFVDVTENAEVFVNMHNNNVTLRVSPSVDLLDVTLVTRYGSEVYDPKTLYITLNYGLGEKTIVVRCKTSTLRIFKLNGDYYCHDLAVDSVQKVEGAGVTVGEHVHRLYASKRDAANQFINFDYSSGNVNYYWYREKQHAPCFVWSYTSASTTNSFRNLISESGIRISYRPSDGYIRVYNQSGYDGHIVYNYAHTTTTTLPSKTGNGGYLNRGSSSFTANRRYTLYIHFVCAYRGDSTRSNSYVMNIQWGANSNLQTVSIRRMYDSRTGLF